MRMWLQERVDAAGGVRKLARQADIKHPQISAALGGEKVSTTMLAKISEIEGMSMARIFDRLAELATQREKMPMRATTEPVLVTTAQGARALRVPQHPLPTPKATPRASEADPASADDAPTPKQQGTRQRGK
jgi:hypothetical protein